MDRLVEETLRALRSVGQHAVPDLLDELVGLVQGHQIVILTGVGKSYLVAQQGAALLRSVGINAQAIHATDMVHGDMGVTAADTTLLIALSHSGQTREVLDASSEVDTFTIAITGDPDSMLAEESDFVLPYTAPRDGSKHGTIPTISTACQTMWLNLIACRIADQRDILLLKSFHPGGTLYV